MKKLKIFLIIFLFLFIFINASQSQSSSLVTSVSGVVKNGESITVDGSGFGSHALNIEWLGGNLGNIEQGTEGNIFSKQNWTSQSESTAFYPPKYTTENSHSGTKSIVSAYPLETIYGSGFYFDTGQTFGKIYATWWVYFNHYDSRGQWKMWRIRPNSSVSDVNGEIYYNNWYQSTGDCEQAQIYIFCDKQDYAQCYPDSNASFRWSSCSPVNKWYRVELYAQESSTAGVRDGTLVIKIHPQNEDEEIKHSWIDDIMTRPPSDSDRWRYFWFQNYWGNISGGDGTGEKIYMDDIYIQIGTRARVEIGDSSSWNNCKHREIQYPTSWSDSSLVFTLNQGSFPNCQEVFLFVVDDDGNVSDQDTSITGFQGYPLRIITEEGEAPCPPLKRSSDSSIIQ